mgnify:CR=1 FL=1
MPDNKNNDVINDILNELDSRSTQPEEPAEQETISETNFIDDPAIEETQQIPDPVSSTQPVSHTEIEEEPSIETPQRNVRPASSVPPKGKKRKRKRKRNRLPGVLILTVFIFAVSICLSLVIIAFGKDMLGIGKGDTTHLIVVQEGETTEQIAQMLQEEGIIKSPECFKLFMKLRKSNDTYIAGEHFLSPNMAYETIISKLTDYEEEEKETVEVTFPEGITIYDAANILEENGVCSAEDFIFYFNSGGYGFEFEQRLPVDTSLKFNRMEGYVFPDTYYFYSNMDPEQVCQKIYNNFNSKMTDERYAQMEKLGLSLDQLITFASIVQKEAASVDTMTLVASVFWNRYNNQDVFPLLQSDPTSNYANDVIKPHMEVYDETIIDAYDTYKGAGLPPGAICNPGLEAIDAVLANFQSPYFYFIANINTGQTYFSETLEEHEANQAIVEEQYAEQKAAEATADDTEN